MKEGDLNLLFPTTKSDPSSSSMFGKSRFKFYAPLAAIVLLAFWSMLTGTVSLNSSAGNLTSPDDDLRQRDDDLDVLEVEEREKVVRHMWDVYTHSRRIRLPSFWEEAFEAAYEDLATDDVVPRDAAVSEIAKMSMIRMVNLDPKNGATKSFGDRVGRANNIKLPSTMQSVQVQ